MTDQDETVSTSRLTELRNRIDELDEIMHNALIERAEVIDTLVSVKQTSKSGIAFRPGREASMMRIMMQRHCGNLPSTTVEHVWREIIASFTNIQAPFAVHIHQQPSFALHDAARFQFGFAVPVRHHSAPSDVIEAVAGSAGDLGLVAKTDDIAEAWWNELTATNAPKIIGKLPFVIRSDHPAPEPCFILSHPVEEQGGFDKTVSAVTLEESALANISNSSQFEILAHLSNDDHISALIATKVANPLEDTFKSIPGIQSWHEVGGYAEPYQMAPK